MLMTSINGKPNKTEFCINSDNANYSIPELSTATSYLWEISRNDIYDVLERPKGSSEQNFR